MINIIFYIQVIIISKMKFFKQSKWVNIFKMKLLKTAVSRNKIIINFKT